MTRPRPKAAAAVPGFTLLKSLAGATAVVGGRTSVGVLTYPVRDADRDTVKPDGGVWDRLPYCDWDHGCPIGTGSVELRTLPGPDGSPVAVPVGTTRFATARDDLRGLHLKGYPASECLDTAHAAWELVRAGLVDGLSIEFTPLPGGARANGRWSPVNDRASYDFTHWRGHGWAVTPDPVNSHARLFTDGVGAELARVAQTGRLPGGTRAPRTVLKSLSRLARPGRPSAVPGHAFPPPTPEPAVPAPADEYDDEDGYPYPEIEDGDDAEAGPDPEQPEGGDAPAPELGPNATAGMQVVQGLRDLADQAEALGASPQLEHGELKTKLAEVAELLHGHADDTHDAVAGFFPDAGLERAASADEPEADPADADGEGDEEEDEDEGDEEDDGVVKTKSFPRGVPNVLRFSLGDAKPVAKSATADGAETAKLRKSLKAANRRVKELTAALVESNRAIEAHIGRGR